MNKFSYSAGLPGFGVNGRDGSNGLGGLSMYFSSFDGNTDIATLKSKISANKILFPIDQSLPNKRVYQSGDTFMDIFGSVFNIDLTNLNLYTYSGYNLNTTSIFEEGSQTSHTPTYQRYFNSINNTIDSVYVAAGVADYTQSPINIYGVKALDFAEIKYVDNDTSSFQPYIVFANTTDITKPQQSIALVKETAKNSWHLGNLDGLGNVRDVSLILDFNNVKVTKDLYVSHDVSIIGNVNTSGYLITNGNISSRGDVFMTNSHVSGNEHITSYLNVAGDVSVLGMSSLQYTRIFNGLIIYKGGLDVESDGPFVYSSINMPTTIQYIKISESSINSTDNSKDLCLGNDITQNGNVILGRSNEGIITIKNKLNIIGDVSIS